jgi:hypothetical protein
MSTGIWTPLIEPSSDLGVRAFAVLEAISNSPTTSNSNLDVPLLLAYRALADGNPRWMKFAVDRLNTAIAGADALYSTRRFELFGGLCGLGWVTEHVTRQVRHFQGSEGRSASHINDDTDSALLLELQRGRWRGTCDLETGLTGIGLYFLQRLPAARAKQGLELVIGHLEASSFCEGGAGIGRGLAGTLFLLGEAATAGVDAPRANRLLAKGTGALLDRLSESTNSCAWSEGGLGVAAVCLRLKPDECLHLLERCLEAVPAGPDVSLLNGAAGAAHMWNRASRMTRDARCREASLAWWEKAIEHYEETTIAADAAGAKFLGGSAGVALALLAALTPVEPAWDGLLCLSLQPKLMHGAGGI